ncbi:GNRHR [Mytilus coruscus]|uniref:GNRHR n=1 Tax=Mytilus coruscus TaxID=42192 RepID=A0A6J8ERS3_MYTCO|nr:GNRHR [Mytilus coruscus]
MLKLGATIAAVLIASVLLSFHVCSIYVSVTSKELRKNRFLVLALYLSLSDSAVGLIYIYHGILNFLNLENSAYFYQCMMLKHVACGTIIASLLQTLLICLERLNATFRTKRHILDIITNNVSVLICFIVSLCFSLLRFGLETLKGPVPCESEQTLTPLFVFSHDLPAVAIVLLIIIIYGIIVYRMVKQQKVVGVQTRGVPADQSQKKKNNDLRMRRNVLTLGVIISVTVVGVLPRSLLGFYSFSEGISEKVTDLSMITNTVFMMLNPLLDPVIYVLRIKKYRELLRCKCFKRSNVSSVNSTSIE